jgi:predicted glycosyltransferase
MRILFDVAHPAHVHFFREPMRQLVGQGHHVVITSRSKDVALDLLSELGIANISLSTHQGGGVFSLLKELFKRDRALIRVVRDEQIDIMAAIGGTFIAHASRFTGVPSLVFYDTENATLQNLITYPFASHVFVPRAYQAWTPKRHTRYPGYHELSYLHPTYFQPDRSVAIENGLAKSGSTFLIRLVSWQANHDIGEAGWTDDLLGKVIEKLAPHGKVLISSEAALPEPYDQYRYPGRASDIHHVMAFCQAHIGESATMASESAVLGVPAIYAAYTGRGYTDEQETRYGLVKNLRELEWGSLETAIEPLLQQDKAHWGKARDAMLADTIDVAQYVVECVNQYPRIPELA